MGLISGYKPASSFKLALVLSVLPSLHTIISNCAISAWLVKNSCQCETTRPIPSPSLKAGAAMDKQMDWGKSSISLFLSVVCLHADKSDIYTQGNRLLDELIE